MRAVREPDPQRAYFAPLTGLRAIAAGSVAVFHYAEALRVFDGTEIPLLRFVLGNGQAGVSIFFALSGFLITLRYRDAFAAGRIRFRDYWLKRFTRIYPVYFVALMLLVVLPQVLAGDPAYGSPGVVLGLIGLLQAFSLGLFALGIPVGWTLTIEEIYYLFSPALGRFLDRGTPARIIGFGVGLAAASVAVFALTQAFPATTAWTGFNTEFLYGTSFFIRLPEFLAGMVCALLLLRHRARVQVHASALIHAGIALGAVGLLAGNYFFFGQEFSAYGVCRFSVALGAALLMLGLSCAPAHPVARELGTPVMDYLGKTSYGLYLVHLTIPLQFAFAQLHYLPLHPFAAVAIAYGLACLASFALYEWVEHPAQRWLNARLGLNSRDG